MQRLRLRNPVVETVFYERRCGQQFASNDYQEALKKQEMVCSMSRKGNCWDNAVAESFFHTLKVELVHDEKFKTRREAMAAIFEYMEVFFDGQRIHSALGGLTPAEFEHVYSCRHA